jgi:hypothetical protein
MSTLPEVQPKWLNNHRPDRGLSLLIHPIYFINPSLSFLKITSNHYR